MADALRFIVKSIAIKELVQLTLVGTATPEVLDAISRLYGQAVLVVPDEEAELEHRVLKPTVAR